MSSSDRARLSRRALLGGVAGTLAAPAFAQSTGDTTEFEGSLDQGTRRNISSFRTLDWRPYFDSTRNGAILVDITSRALHFWSEDQRTYRLYPTSVPMSEDLTRLGRTEVIQKVEGPSWGGRRPRCESAILNARVRATRSRQPRWEPTRSTSAGRITASTAPMIPRKIGRRSSNGCVGLYNEHIAELFGLTRVGTQVLLI